MLNSFRFRGNRYALFFVVRSSLVKFLFEAVTGQTLTGNVKPVKYRPSKNRDQRRICQFGEFEDPRFFELRVRCYNQKHAQFPIPGFLF